ncbi:hypothetical protein [Aeromonas sp. L_1B5_3]|uniref:hypothetical protein n=1 Tax=Aeromonas sp. L_1B5_3 TaxID=1588629 RepID=UPI000AED52CB|nr:hypothetical protein [Aeromonas sp. L_1B5_3]
MSVIDEDGESDFVIPSWSFEIGLMLHLVDVLNEQASICVHESIVNSFLEVSDKKISFSLVNKGFYLPNVRYFVSPLVSNLIAHHRENGMSYVAITYKYGISVRSVMRRMQSIKRVGHEN